MPLYYSGRRLTIEQTEDAAESWAQAVGSVPGNQASCPAALAVRIKRLADYGVLHGEKMFREEGKTRGDVKVFAIKAKCGLRAYGWYHTKRRGVFVISHFIFKSHKKMRDQDRQRLERNRLAYEGEDDG